LKAQQRRCTLTNGKKSETNQNNFEFEVAAIVLPKNEAGDHRLEANNYQESIN